MTTKLTPEQEAIVAECREKWTGIGFSTETIDQAKATAALAVAYEKLVGQPLPRVEFCAGIRDAVHMRARYLAADVNDAVPADVLPDKAHALELAQYESRLSNWADGRLGGGAWASWHGWAEALRRLDVPDIERVDYVNAVAEQVSFWWPYDKVVIVADRPLAIRVDERTRLHGEGVPAIEWRDGYKMWFHHGVSCNEKVITGDFTPRDVLDEQNAEVRRAMCEIKGWAWVIEGLGAKKVSADEYGTVWSVDLNQGLEEWQVDDGNKALLVEVVNSSPEPDGSYKVYFLSVDPQECDGWSATECIGWTFSLPRGSYRPEKMT